MRRPLPVAPVLAAFAAILAALLALVPALFGLEPPTGRAAGLVVLTVGLWATGVVPEFVTALVFFTLAMLARIAPPDVIFAGFQSTAWWLVFGGLVVGVAVTRTGLGERLARTLVDALASSYPRLIAGVVAISGGIAFLMPSTMGRVVLLLPIVLALADRVGFVAGRRGRTAMVLAAAFGTYMIPAAILPANVPNMVMAGTVETVFGVTLTYGGYLWLHMPVTGLLKGVVLVALLCRLFPDRPDPAAGERERRPLSAAERRLAAILVVTLGFWTTDFMHGISPAWVGLTAALVCLMPVSGLVPAAEFSRSVNFASLIYVAGVLGMAALVTHSGLGAVLSAGLLAVIPLEPGADALNFASLTGAAAALGVISTMPGLPAILSPLAGELAGATGWPLVTVIMTQVVGFSVVFFPYQVPPLVVALQLGNVRVAEALRLSIPLALVTLAVLTPLNFLWWRLTGWIP